MEATYSPERPREIAIGKTVLITEQNGKEVETEIFTMSMGTETIELLPLRNWGQLDVYKWRVRGKLPGTPAGLEITPEHVKIGGDTVRVKDPDGCSKLERAFAEWLALERQTLEAARKKPKPAPTTPEASHSPATHALHYQVEVDKGGQAHIRCLQGKETAAQIGLTLQGFNGLFSQGLMRKPHTLKVGALHDWVEIDGVLYSFEQGNNSSSALEKALNEKYTPTTALGQGKDVVIYTNGASSTGFDIQFPVSVGGVPDNRKRPLNEESLDLLQDSEKCGLLHKGLVIKLTRPNLIFKQKTPDGGERYLDKGPQNMVAVADDDGRETLIDLSQPVNYMRLSAVELTAVFNHPSVNKHTKLTPKDSAPVVTQGSPEPVNSPPREPPPPPQLSSEVAAPARQDVPPIRAPSVPAEVTHAVAPEPVPLSVQKATEEKPLAQVVEPPKPSPNRWLEPVLSKTSIRHDWFACLVYGRIAETLGNSREGTFGLSACWAAAMDEVKDIADPAFKGVFLTEKGGFGFTNHEHMARFNKGVAFIGTPESAIEGIDVSLVAIGMDLEQRFVFIVSDGYRSKFGVPDQTVKMETARLKEYGAVILSVKDVLESPEPLEVVWTVPAEQETPGDPQVLESARPDAITREVADTVPA